MTMQAIGNIYTTDSDGSTYIFGYTSSSMGTTFIEPPTPTLMVSAVPVQIVIPASWATIIPSTYYSGYYSYPSATTTAADSNQPNFHIGALGVSASVAILILLLLASLATICCCAFSVAGRCGETCRECYQEFCGECCDNDPGPTPRGCAHKLATGCNQLSELCCQCSGGRADYYCNSCSHYFIPPLPFTNTQPPRRRHSPSRSCKMLKWYNLRLELTRKQ
jgi:hypothetical protein